MSDTKTGQEQYKLDLDIYAKFFIIGFTLYLLDRAYFVEILPIPDGLKSLIKILITFGATAVCVWPMWWNIIRGGWQAILKVPSYAIITTTTYSDGTTKTESDHGEYAMVGGIIMKAMWFCLGYVLAVFATLALFAIQLFTFVKDRNKIINKKQYLTKLALIVCLIVVGPPVARALAPVFDYKHFNHKEIERAAESAQKHLYSGDFSYTLVYSSSHYGNFTADITYTKASDTTVIDVQTISGKKKSNITPGTYVFSGNVLTNPGNLSKAGIEEITKLNPANMIFKRMIDDKRKMRITSWKKADGTYEISIMIPPIGISEEKRFSIDLIKDDDEYKLVKFSAGLYQMKNGSLRN